MKTPTVSVVVAAKNYGRYLTTAINSVFAQTMADWELIVVDDGSTDNTQKMLKPFLRDHRVKVFHADKLGQSRAKNLGVQMARGAWVAFLDADDAWRKRKLELQLNAVAHRPDVGVVFSLRSVINERGKILKSPTSATTPIATLDNLFVQNSVCFSSAMVRRLVMDHVGAFDPRLDLAIDYDLWLRVARHWSFLCVPEQLVLYRTGHGNLSAKVTDRVATAFVSMARAQRRGGISAKALSQGHAETNRTLGFVLRGRAGATKAYWAALAWPHKRLVTLKGMVGALVTRKPTSHFAPENEPANR